MQLFLISSQSVWFRSGIVEVPTEEVSLLDDLVEWVDSEEKRREEEKQSDENARTESLSTGERIRESALTGMVTDDEETPKRKKKKSLEEVIDERNSGRMSVKLRELEVDEKRLVLEKQKVDLEHEKLNLEKTRLEQLDRVMAQQDRMFSMLSELVKNK